MSDQGKVLVTGATGFVGSLLAPALLTDGWTVRRGARQPGKARPSAPTADWVRLELDDDTTLFPALTGCAVAVYLVHGLVGARPGYERREAAQAERFRVACERAGVGRIVYLGGLAPEGTPSRHLAGRLAVGHALAQGPIPCIELRASMIVGGGSASFRMLRDLAARLPAMVLPRWLQSRTEPIAVDDVVAALVAACKVPLPASKIYDLEGPEVLTCQNILLRMAGSMGITPRTARVPMLTPRLSSWWIRFVSGVDVPLARELVEGLSGDLLATHRGFRELAGLPPPLPFDEAVRRALAASPASSTTPWLKRWEKLVPLLSPKRPHPPS